MHMCMDLLWRLSPRTNSFDSSCDVFPVSPQPYVLPFLSPSAVHVMSSHSSWNHSPLYAVSLSRLSLISHRSFILFHASGTPVQSYLLTIKQNTRVIPYRAPFNIYPSSIFVPTRLPRLARSLYLTEILSSTANFSPLLYTFPLHRKVSLDIIFFTYFFRIFFHDLYIHSLSLSFSQVCFLFSSSSIRYSFIPPFLFLSFTYQQSLSIHSCPLILSSRISYLLFFSSFFLPPTTAPPFASAYCPTRLLSKSVYTSAFSLAVCAAFSVFFQFAWNRFSFSPAIGFAFLFPAAQRFTDSSRRVASRLSRNTRSF